MEAASYPESQQRADGARTLEDCPYCASCLVQPCAWRELGEGRLRLRLRCPECEAMMTGTFDAARVIDYDQSLVRGRHELVLAYERVLRDNLSAEASRLAHALELDLIGPDDFG